MNVSDMVIIIAAQLLVITLVVYKKNNHVRFELLLSENDQKQVDKHYEFALNLLVILSITFDIMMIVPGLILLVFS